MAVAIKSKLDDDDKVNVNIDMLVIINYLDATDEGHEKSYLISNGILRALKEDDYRELFIFSKSNAVDILADEVYSNIAESK